MVIIKEIIRTYYACDETIRVDIDMAIETLAKDGILSERQLLIIQAVKEQYSFTAIAKMLELARSEVERYLDLACASVSSYLGSEYQDSKVLGAVTARLGRELTPEEEFFCWKKMRDFGRNKYAKVNIYNFKIKNGKITIEDGLGKTEGQVDV